MYHLGVSDSSTYQNNTFKAKHSIFTHLLKSKLGWNRLNLKFWITLIMFELLFLKVIQNLKEYYLNLVFGFKFSIFLKIRSKFIFSASLHAIWIRARNCHSRQNDTPLVLEFKRKLHFSPQQKAYTFNLTKHIFTNFSVVPKTNKVSYMHTHIFWPKLTFFSPFEITFFWTLYHWNFGMCSKPNLTLPHLLGTFWLFNLYFPAL